MAEQPEAISEDAVLAGGLEIMSGTMPVTGGPYDGKIVPVLCFRFHSSEGGVYPDVILAVEPRELKAMWREVRARGNAAVAAAGRLRG